MTSEDATFEEALADLVNEYLAKGSGVEEIVSAFEIQTMALEEMAKSAPHRRHNDQ